MSNKPSHNYPGAVCDVQNAALKIQSALKSDLYGPNVLVGMTPTFQADFDALITSLVNAVESQWNAKGNVHTGTEDQKKAKAETIRHTGAARDVAKLTFPTNPAVLHDEFAVGHRAPYGITAIISRAQQVHAACVKYAEPMAINGWSAAKTTKLAELIATLGTANISRSDAASLQKGNTGGVMNLANAVYKQIRAIQIAADLAYPETQASSDSSILDCRGKYLLGIYPPRVSADEDVPAESPAAGAGGGTTGASPSEAPGTVS